MSTEEETLLEVGDYYGVRYAERRSRRELVWDYDSPNNLVCYKCKSYTVVCLDRCSRHYCTTCTSHQKIPVAPYGTEDVMSPRSRWKYGMGIGNRSVLEAVEFMNDHYMNSRTSRCTCRTY